jgi:septal ring factor EnvC (AmiA/AmiB activator)
MGTPTVPGPIETKQSNKYHLTTQGVVSIVVVTIFACVILPGLFHSLKQARESQSPQSKQDIQTLQKQVSDLTDRLNKLEKQHTP